MQQSSLKALYQSRCFNKEDKLIPHYWNPQPISNLPFTLWGDDDMVIDEDISLIIHKILALGLELELPVGSFIKDGLHKDLPDDPFTLPLLKSNMADEATHFKGFTLASNSYLVPSYLSQEALSITNQWISLSDLYHPIHIAQILETSIFLISLGILRLIGGSSLSTFAARISQDEARHVSTNTSILLLLDIDPTSPPSPALSLRNQTLDWVFSDFPSLSLLDFPISLDFLLDSSNQLLFSGSAPIFNDLVFISDYFPPFESPNSELYSRSLTY